MKKDGYLFNTDFSLSFSDVDSNRNGNGNRNRSKNVFLHELFS